ncbi:hypothetical protein Plhal304r1_c020g0072651 [Plasmopara halstedii]
MGDDYLVEYIWRKSSTSRVSFSSMGIRGGRVRQRCDMSPAQTLWTLCLFPNLSTSWGRGIITNRLDEAQKQ